MAAVKVDRYALQQRLGEGAMGVVYAADDDLLDRQVAIKLVRDAAAGEAGAAQRQRLLREARAMAKLAHPNVLAVFGAGTVELDDGEQVFIAMALAPGGSLRAWREAEVRPWREVLARYLDAGRGLAAAHAAGLVHRDFKPDNLLLADDGRVLVADFGMVADGGEAHSTEAPAGTGTPAYMAPEQHRGDRVGPAADQFAFCVALWEALHGERPFRGESRGELAASVERGPLAAPPGEVPAWITAALARGLAPRAEDRWPSMDALVDALERDPAVAARARRRRLLTLGLAGAVSAVAVGVVVLLLVRGGGDDAAAKCRNASSRRDAIWDAEARAALERAFVDTGRPYAPDTFARVADRLDAHAASWSAMRIEACEATHVRHEDPIEVLDRRMWCLDGNAAEARAAIEGLSRGADPAVLDRALRVIAGLEDPAACAEAQVLAGGPALPTDPAQRAVLSEIQARAAAIAPALLLRRFDEARPIIDEVLADARALGYLPLVAQTLHHRAVLEKRDGKNDAAEATFYEAAQIAAEAHDDRRSAKIWVALVILLSTRSGRTAEAERLLPVITAALARIGHLPEEEGRLYGARAVVATAQGRPADALADYLHALPLYVEAFGDQSDEVSTLYTNIGVILSKLSRYDEALAYAERAVTLREVRYGPDHPEVADAMNNLAVVRADAGRYTEALAAAERSLAIRERAVGAEHIDTAVARVNVGGLLNQLGRPDEARLHLERALAIQRAANGPDHLSLASTNKVLGSIAYAQERFADARAHYAEALRIFELVSGPDHTDVAAACLQLAQVVRVSGQYDEAEALAKRALAIFEVRSGPDSANASNAIEELATLHARRGDRAQARAMFERALAIAERTYGAEHPQTAFTLYKFGAALHELGDRAGARKHLQRSLAINEAALGPAHPLVVETHRLLAD